MFQVGESCEVKEVVTAEKTAAAVGSGGLEVYATPMMIALMERAALTLCDRHMVEGATTVGTAMSITHESASPVGMEVRAVATVVAFSQRQVQFSVEAYDSQGLIGKGTHTRFIVASERFYQKANSKLAQVD